MESQSRVWQLQPLQSTQVSARRPSGVGSRSIPAPTSATGRFVRIGDDCGVENPVVRPACPTEAGAGKGSKDPRRLRRNLYRKLPVAFHLWFTFRLLDQIG